MILASSTEKIGVTSTKPRPVLLLGVTSTNGGLEKMKNDKEVADWFEQWQEKISEAWRKGDDEEAAWLLKEAGMPLRATEKPHTGRKRSTMGKGA